MAEYLSNDDIMAIAQPIREAFQSLLRSPMLIRRPKSRQWVFLQRLFESLFGEITRSFGASPTQLAQYKFEVESRLRQYYEIEGSGPIRYIFAIRNRNEALSRGLIDEKYPFVDGYVILISDTSGTMDFPPKRASRQLMERVVDDAFRAELAVYRACPVADLSFLDGLFVKGGNKYKYIANIAKRHHIKGWTINQPPENPSTARLLNLRVLKIDGGSAKVRTVEYWYLRWWSIKERKYVENPWKETSTIIYWLNLVNGRWLVDADYMPKPRAQSPRRMRRNLN
jgi:hypothetical protein